MTEREKSTDAPVSPEDYRRHAADCVRIAESTADPQHRLHLIDMAQSWLRLAEQAEKNLTTDIVYETPSRSRNADQPQQQQQQQQSKTGR